MSSVRATPALGPPIEGPSALGESPRRLLYLALTLAVTDFKLRFFGSVLGYFWQLLRPLMLFGVLYVVFTEIVKIGGLVPFYPVVLLTNIVLFTWFAESTGAISSLVDREALLRKIRFPRLAVPLAVIFTATFNMLLNASVIVIFALASGVRPRWSWLQLPLLLLALMALMCGVAMLLSALYVRYRDVRPIWEVALQILFYATPVIYAVETIDQPDWFKEGLMINPLASILQQVRHAVIDPGAPSAVAAAGGGLRLLVPALIVAATVVVGFWVFSREAPRIAEDL